MIFLFLLRKNGRGEGEGEGEGEERRRWVGEVNMEAQVKGLGVGIDQTRLVIIDYRDCQ